MMSTVVIGAEVLDLVRDGLRSQIALAAQQISSADEQPDGRKHPERYQDPLRYQDALRALLETIGWSTPPSDQKIGLNTHAWALLEALQDQLSDHADKLRDTDPDDEQDDERRDIVTRDMNALSTLAVIVLLRTQAGVLRPGATTGVL
jgi:hypothetical protein